jgi:hypothetical protein
MDPKHLPKDFEAIGVRFARSPIVLKCEEREFSREW